MARIQIRRGNHDALPNSGMLPGEPLVTLDRGNLHVASDPTTRVAVTPAVDELTTLAAVATDDLLLVHDASESSNQMEKRITFQAFKTALNIPSASTDELVAVTSGETSGYLWGTDGSDGVIRMGASMAWDRSGAAVTLNVSVVDGGTF